MQSGATVPPEAIQAGIAAMHACINDPKASKRDKQIALKTLLHAQSIEQGAVRLEMDVDEHDLMSEKIEHLEQQINKENHGT